MNNFFKKTVLACTLAFTFAASSIGMVACDNTQKPNPDENPPAEQTYEVTFHYDFAPDGAYDETTKQPDTYLKTEVLESKGEAITVSRALQRKFDCVEGYSTCGYSTESWKTSVTADLDVYVLYEALPTYTITFKNVDGSVIEEVKVPVGTEYVSAQYPEKVTYLIDTTAYNALNETAKGAYEAYSAKSGWYILSAQKTGYIAIETGKVFTEFTGNMGDFNADVVMTATDAVADKQVKLNANANITVDGNKDATYTHVSSLPYRFSSTDCTILLKYKTLEEATAAGKAEEWTKAKNTYDAQEGNKYALETYMAWDGDWIYIFMEVTKPNVATIGKAGMQAIGANPRGDGVELWYTLGKNYGEMNSRQFGTLAIDAFGSQCVHPGYQFAYGDFLTYTSKLQNTTYDVTTWNGEAYQTDATGYNVEIKMPAYVNVYDLEAVSETFGGEGWGEKVTNGMPMVFSTELKAMQSIPSAEDIATMVETGSADSVRDNYGLRTMGGGWTTNTPNTSKTDYRIFDTTVVFVA